MSLAPQNVTKIDSDTFFSKYEPREQPDGNMIHEHHAARQNPINHVWSIVESSVTEDLYAVPGYRVINVIGYAVTEKPWEHEHIEAEWFIYDDDFQYLDLATDMAYFDGSNL